MGVGVDTGRGGSDGDEAEEATVGEEHEVTHTQTHTHTQTNTHTHKHTHTHAHTNPSLPHTPTHLAPRSRAWRLAIPNWRRASRPGRRGMRRWSGSDDGITVFMTACVYGITVVMTTSVFTEEKGVESTHTSIYTYTFTGLFNCITPTPTPSLTIAALLHLHPPLHLTCATHT